MGIDVMRLKALRIEKGYTQESLAKAMNTSRSTVAMWETRKNGIDDDTLAALADLFGCTTDYLLGRSDTRTVTVDTVREDLRNNPSRRTLLNLLQYGSDQDVNQVAALVDALKKTNPDFGGGDDPA